MQGHMDSFLKALWQDSIIEDQVDEAAKSKVKTNIAKALFNEVVTREKTEQAGDSLLLLCNDNENKPESEKPESDTEPDADSEPEDESELNDEITGDDGDDGDDCDSDIEVLTKESKLSHVSLFGPSGDDRSEDSDDIPINKKRWTRLKQKRPATAMGGDDTDNSDNDDDEDYEPPEPGPKRAKQGSRSATNKNKNKKKPN